METLTRALRRYGGMVVQPRKTAAGLDPNEGVHDGAWLGGLYLLSIGVLEILRGVATARATANLSGLLMLVTAVGRVLVVPIVVLVACETVLGRSRSYRRGLMLVPLVLVVAAAHELTAQGLSVPNYGPEIVGGVLSIGLAAWVREAIPSLSEGSQ
ncbi:MAG: hypothetical protein AAGF11_54160 [Myxococcota bacterium]